jgi:RNA-directed DNA polymerase
VDVDLEQFFDRVNHDVLMGRLEKRIGDGRVLRLIRRYLEVGMLANGVSTERHEGMPQGGPLSPLLANVLLDEVDKELEKRGHSFVRYADDCNVYVRSRRAGERVMGLLQRLYTRLKLRINEAKSAVAIATSRKLLGYSFWDAPGRTVKCRIAKKALETMKERVRLITRRTVGRSIERVATELRRYLSPRSCHGRHVKLSIDELGDGPAQSPSARLDHSRLPSGASTICRSGFWPR